MITIVVLSGVAFLIGIVFGMLILFVISIHRTSRTPLSEIDSDCPGSISRRVLTGVRVNREESGE
jgi:hypothetical protein